MIDSVTMEEALRMIGRLTLAGMLGMVIGIERTYRAKTAGLHLVAVSATVLALIGLEVLGWFNKILRGKPEEPVW